MDRHLRPTDFLGRAALGMVQNDDQCGRTGCGTGMHAETAPHGLESGDENRRLRHLAGSALGGFLCQHTGSNVSIGVACVATSCFFTTLFDPLVNRKRIQWKNILLSFIAIAGIFFIFSIDVRFRLGITLGLLCAALYSLFSILNINVANETKEDSATMLLYELIGGVLFLTLCIPVFHSIYPAEPVLPVGNDLLSLLLLGSVFTVIPFLFQLQALRKLTAFTVNMAYNLEPVYSIGIAAVLFGELQEVGFSFWVGISLIVLSVVLQTYSVVRAKSDS